MNRASRACPASPGRQFRVSRLEVGFGFWPQWVAQPSLAAHRHIRLVNDMKHTFIFTAAAAIWLCPIGLSQSAPTLTRVDTSPDGTATLIVRNDSDVSLVAFVDVEESHPVASDGKKYKVTAVRWWDVATDLAQPVAPHHEIGILTGTPGAPPQATLMAAVFGDGSSFGDPAWVQRIMIRRQVMRDGFDLAFSLLEKGMREGTPRADLIKQLTASIVFGVASGDPIFRYGNCFSGALIRDG